MITKKLLRAYIKRIGKSEIKEHDQFFLGDIYAKAQSMDIMNLGDKLHNIKRLKDEFKAFTPEQKQEFWVMYHALVY
jgi:hypothetical protein